MFIYVTRVFVVLLQLILIFGDNIVLVHVLYRHGDRAPYITIPTDLNNTEESWSQGLSELTELGMEQSFKLGELFQQKYSGKDKLLNLDYVQPEIYVYADDYNRTLVSSMAVLAGLYSKSKSNMQIQGGAISWQIIPPVHTIELERDIVLYWNAHCPKTNKIFREIVKRQNDFKTFEKTNQPLLDYLTKHCGYKVTLDNIEDIYDPLMCEYLHFPEHEWPSYINRTIFEQIKRTLDTYVHYTYCHPTVAKLRGGNLLGDIVKRMQQKITSLSTKKNDESLKWVRRLKMYQYSAHDITVMSLLNTLGASKYDQGEYPRYASSISVELWVDKKDGYFVKVYYRHGYDKDFVRIQVSGCPEIPKPCPVETFIARSINFISDDWKKECAS